MKKIGLFYATKADKTTWVAEKIQKEFGKDRIEVVPIEQAWQNDFAAYDGIGLLAEVFEGDGATLVGFTSSEGYTFERSRALRGDRWCGLVVDLDNQSEQAEKRIREWCEQVKNEFDSKP